MDTGVANTDTTKKSSGGIGETISVIVQALLLALVIEATGRAGAPLAAAVLALSVVMAAMYGVLFGLNWRALRT